MSGITFDKGTLIALERPRVRARQVIEHAMERDLAVTVPAHVLAEWRRARTDVRDAILECVEVEPLSEALAKAAGEALGAVRGSTLVDAVVMASAASRGDVVYTNDVEDLERLRRHFPTVRVLAV